MTIDKKFKEKWKKSEKEYVRGTILKEAFDFLSQQAFNDFGMQQGAIGMELSKLILIARDCLEKNIEKNIEKNKSLLKQDKNK